MTINKIPPAPFALTKTQHSAKGETKGTSAGSDLQSEPIV